ncbi:hypothetical protein DER45DRAFT_576788 [Fusarium avenaceum]|nr:hypothetical protein DER45DRAFT_576788 [Fusarium avenaceum]
MRRDFCLPFFLLLFLSLSYVHECQGDIPPLALYDTTYAASFPIFPQSLLDLPFPRCNRCVGLTEATQHFAVHTILSLVRAYLTLRALLSPGAPLPQRNKDHTPLAIDPRLSNQRSFSAGVDHQGHLYQ